MTNLSGCFQNLQLQVQGQECVFISPEICYSELIMELVFIRDDGEIQYGTWESVINFDFNLQLSFSSEIT